MKFTRLDSAQEVRDLVEYHNRNSEFVVLDTETTSVNPRLAKLLDVQISGYGEDEAVIFSADKASLLADFSKRLVLVAHSYKYDAHVLFRHGLDLLSRTWRDILLIGHLLDENRESHSLDNYVKEYWNDDYKEIFWSKYKTYEEASEDDRVEYACRDIVYTDRLYRRFCYDLLVQNIPSGLVQHVHQLQASLLQTEIHGIQVDRGYLEELGVRLKQRIDELEPQMRSCIRDEIEILELEAWQKEIEKRKSEKGKARVPRPKFNFESSRQLQDLLYNMLGLPRQFNQKTKAVSTDYDCLERIKDAHPIVGLIQENRELQKIYTSYIIGTLDRLDGSVIYPQFRVNGTATGRISHHDPNLGQLPKTGGVRGIYVPNPGRRFISADYGQLEVIIEANVTRDVNLHRMLLSGSNKHDLTSKELHCDRAIAKKLNFAMQYWCGPRKVAKLLNCSETEGQKIYDKYWSIYSGSKRLKDKTDRMVARGEPLVNLFGRKRRFPPGHRTIWDKDLRRAYNFLIQGTGADITNRAFYLIAEELQKSGQGRALFTVHDEIIIEVNADTTEYWTKRLKEVMLGVGVELELQISLQVEVSKPCERWTDK